LHVSETVLTHTSQNGNGTKYFKDHATVFDLSRANKKYLKCDGKTFILPHKRKYGIVSDLACRRNC